MCSTRLIGTEIQFSSEWYLRAQEIHMRSTRLTGTLSSSVLVVSIRSGMCSNRLMGTEIQFSTRWYLRAGKSPYALRPVPAKFAQSCL